MLARRIGILSLPFQDEAGPLDRGAHGLGELVAAVVIDLQPILVQAEVGLSEAERPHGREQHLVDRNAVRVLVGGLRPKPVIVGRVPSDLIRRVVPVHRKPLAIQGLGKGVGLTLG